MQKSLYTPHYELLTKKLRKLREDAGLSQRELAERLHRGQTMVARTEQGQRRLDLIEFFAFCKALGADPVQLVAQLQRECRGLDKGAKRRGRSQ